MIHWRRIPPELRTVLLILGWLVATTWLRPLALPDEGRYVGVAWEMLSSGNWLVPTLDGSPYFHKPPLFYWITAASLAAFGPSEAAARVAPLLGALTGSVALWLFVKRWVGERHAQLSLLVLLTQPLFYIGAQFANLDMLVAGCITATILQLAHVCLETEQGNRPRAALAGAYVCAALGVLAKGLIGLAIPVLVIAAWLLAGRRHRLVMSLLWAPGIAILALVGAPWFLAMQWQFSDFTRYFFMLQQFERFVGGGFNNAQPWWFFLAAVPILALPWALWVPLAIRRARGDDPTRMRVRRLMWCWLGAVLLFFSVPQSKLIGYVLPAAPPLAFLIADAACPILQGRAGVRRLWFTSLGLAGVICVGVVTAFAIQQPKSQRPVGEYLAAHRASHEPVVFLDDYFFDVPFYARLDRPAVVIGEWQSGSTDGWRKELLDASRFAATAAPNRLMTPAELPTFLCGVPVAWVVARHDAAQRFPWLAAFPVAASTSDAAVWRIERGTATIAGARNRHSAWLCSRDDIG